MLISFRLLSFLPLGLLYGLSSLLYWLAFRIARLRVAVVRANLERSFPDRTAVERAALADAYHRQICDVAVEVIKGFRLSRTELAQRVQLEGFDAVRERLAGGQPIMLLAAHQCNWEWLALAVSAELGYPVEAIYKPLRGASAERTFLRLRSRFGGRLVPAKDVVRLIIQKRDEPRAVAMLADQVPRSSPSRVWTRFLNQDTAFYRGAEEISRAAGYPVFFLSMRRLSRGHYQVRASLLADGKGAEPQNTLTLRYVRLLELMIRQQPEGWFWSHDRWKIKKPLYAQPVT
jgi:KDO2-lipid IV(A) lauroyltransferase